MPTKNTQSNITRGAPAPKGLGWNGCRRGTRQDFRCSKLGSHWYKLTQNNLERLLAQRRASVLGTGHAPRWIGPLLPVHRRRRHSALLQALRWRLHSGVGGRAVRELAGEEGGRPLGFHTLDLFTWSPGSRVRRWGGEIRAQVSPGFTHWTPRGHSLMVGAENG